MQRSVLSLRTSFNVASQPAPERAYGIVYLITMLSAVHNNSASCARDANVIDF